jgi:ketosteroid isomerase-like protein
MQKIYLKQTILAVFLCAFLVISKSFFTSCNQKKTDYINEAYPQVQAQITQSIQDIFKAGKAKNFDILEDFHLNSSKFTKFDNSGDLNRQDYAQNTKGEKEAFSAVDDFDFNITKLKVDVFEHVAVATFVIDAQIKMQGNIIPDTARATLIFVDDQGKWKITHEHFSANKNQ